MNSAFGFDLSLLNLNCRFTLFFHTNRLQDVLNEHIWLEKSQIQVNKRQKDDGLQNAKRQIVLIFDRTDNNVISRWKREETYLGLVQGLARSWNGIVEKRITLCWAILRFTGLNSSLRENTHQTKFWFLKERLSFCTVRVTVCASVAWEHSISEYVCGLRFAPFTVAASNLEFVWMNAVGRRRRRWLNREDSKIPIVFGLSAEKKVFGLNILSATTVLELMGFYQYIYQYQTGQHVKPVIVQFSVSSGLNLVWTVGRAASSLNKKDHWAKILTTRYLLWGRKPDLPIGKLWIKVWGILKKIEG